MILVPLTAGESIGERRDKIKKNTAGRKRNFLKQCKKGCLALNLHRLEPEKKHNLTLRPEVLLKESIKEREDKLCDCEYHAEDQEN